MTKGACLSAIPVCPYFLELFHGLYLVGQFTLKSATSSINEEKPWFSMRFFDRSLLFSRVLHRPYGRISCGRLSGQ